jgi:mitotic spindle assembly checkpoint protein MAD2
VQQRELRTRRLVVGTAAERRARKAAAAARARALTRADGFGAAHDPNPRWISAGVRSILYQRGIYPPESFKKVSKYGLTMLVTTDGGLSEYLENVLSQLSGAARARSVARARARVARLSLTPKVRPGRARRRHPARRRARAQPGLSPSRSKSSSS